MTTVLTTNPERETEQSQRQSRLHDERLAELLDVAAREFLTYGFEGASLTAIAKQTNSSKRTFYSRFPTKENLFIAVIEKRLDFVFSQTSDALPVDPPIEKTLKEYACRIMNLVLSEEHIGLVRVVGMEARRFPELGERFYELGPQRGQVRLSNYFAEQIKMGRLVKEDPTLMAEHCVALVTGGPIRWLVLGLKQKLTDEDRSNHIKAAIRVFLRAYAAPA